LYKQALALEQASGGRQPADDRILTKHQSLNAIFDHEGGTNEEMITRLSDGVCTPEDMVISEFAAQSLVTAVRRLQGRNADILRAFIAGELQADIGVRYRITESRISQIIKEQRRLLLKAIENDKNRRAEAMLKDEIILLLTTRNVEMLSANGDYAAKLADYYDQPIELVRNVIRRLNESGTILAYYDYDNAAKTGAPRIAGLKLRPKPTSTQHAA
jgi:Mor family transcriptional regulator